MPRIAKSETAKKVTHPKEKSKVASLPSARTKPAEDDLATGSNAPRIADGRQLERALGAEIRSLRRERDLSVADLASAANISVGMLSKIENGIISPSLSTIQAVAAALHVPFTALFSSFEEQRDCSFVPKGKGMVIERRGTKAGHIYELLSAVVGSSVKMEPFLITLQKDASPYTGFRHAGIELIYMLSGEVIYRHADKSYRMRPGDALAFDAATLHGPENLVRTPATFLSVIVYPASSDSP